MLYRLRWLFAFTSSLFVVLPGLTFYNYLQNSKRGQTTVLYFNNATLSDSQWEKIARSERHLTYLSFSGSSFADSDIAHLKNLSALKSINFSKTAIGWRALEDLLSQVPLQRIYLDELKSDISNRKNILKSLTKFKNITELSFSQNDLGQFNPDEMVFSPWIDELTIEDNNLTDKSIEALSKLNITTLKISSNNLTGKGFQGFRYLKTLDIGQAHLTAEGLSDIAVSKVSSLSMAKNILADSDLEAFRGSKKLENLSLAETTLTSKSTNLISTLENLTELNLDLTKIFDENAGALANLKHLKVLSLVDVELGPRSTELIAGFAHLRELDLSKTEIDDATVAPLLKISNLEYLNLSQTLISDEALRMPSNSSLSVNVSRTAITREAIKVAKTGGAIADFYIDEREDD